MTSYVTSADGTRIAYDKLGNGPPLVIASGMFCYRPRTQELATALAWDFTVINYDRRGRGESGNTAPYAVEREIEDLEELIGAVGGKASLYGHSSGAGLALLAAANGLPVTRLVLHEPPYSADDEESRRGARELAVSVQLAIRENRRADAIGLFFAGFGMPDEAVEGMRANPEMLALAPTMVHDFEVMGELRGGGIPFDLVRALRMPTLVMAGAESPEFFRDAAERIVQRLPNGKLVMLSGQDHGAPASEVTPVVKAFLNE